MISGYARVAYHEWIELFNGGPDAVDLGGWMLDDILAGGSSPYVFPAGVTLPPGGFLVRYRSGSGVALNQDADTAHLVAPDGRVVDSFAYSSPHRDISYSRTIDGAGEWTDTYPASPGGPNIAPTPTLTLAPTATPTPSRTPTPTATMTAVIYDPDAIQLNEVLPAPGVIDWDGSGTADAEDEWIELYNSSAAVVDLAGWRLDDIAEGGARPYVFPAEVRLSPGAFLVLYRSTTGVALNNDGDTARLLGPDGAEIDAFTYAGSNADGSYSRVIDGAGAWTAAYPPSPGRANVPATPSPTATITPTATRTATPTITPTATSTATPTQFPAGITLNEILPNPQTEDWDEDGAANFRDEWIELYNAGPTAAALGGWVLADATTVYTLPVGTVIWPASYLLLFRDQTGLTLSDYRDEVRLLRPDAVLVDRFAYDSGPGADRSYCRSTDGGGYWTKECYVTPGGANRLLPASSSSGSGPAPTATPAGWGVSIAAARAADVDTRVTVTGTVVYPAGLLARTIYIQDATAGIKVYLRTGDFPVLALGDTVRVTGWTRDYYGEAEISAPNPSYLALLAHGAAPLPLPIATGSMGEAHEGRLVWLAGRIVKYETRALVLDDGTGPARIYFPEELPWRRPYVNIGEFWSAQGVVGQSAYDGPPWIGGYRLVPRVAADVSDRPLWLPVTGGGRARGGRTHEEDDER